MVEDERSLNRKIGLCLRLDPKPGSIRRLEVITGMERRRQCAMFGRARRGNKSMRCCGSSRRHDGLDARKNSLGGPTISGSASRCRAVAHDDDGALS